MSNISTQKRYRKLENIVRELKATYAVSGSLLPFTTTESEEYELIVDSSIYGAATMIQTFTFVPPKNTNLDLLTRLIIIARVEIRGSDYTVVATPEFYVKDNGERDASGRLRSSISYKIDLPGGDYPVYTMKARAVAVSLTGGSFTNSGTVV